MHTSSLSRCRLSPAAVSIARYTPRWWGPGRRDLSLAPSPGLLAAYRAGNIRWWRYEAIYRAETLSRLDPLQIYERLQDSILACWCQDNTRCHRGLVAAWIEQALGVRVPEL